MTGKMYARVFEAEGHLGFMGISSGVNDGRRLERTPPKLSTWSPKLSLCCTTKTPYRFSVGNRRRVQSCQISLSIASLTSFASSCLPAYRLISVYKYKIFVLPVRLVVKCMLSESLRLSIIIITIRRRSYGLDSLH